MLESVVKNCGQTVHDEVASKQTMEELKDLLKVDFFRICLTPKICFYGIPTTLQYVSVFCCGNMTQTIKDKLIYHLKKKKV